MKKFLAFAFLALLVSGAAAFAQSGADGTIIRRRDLLGGSSILPASLQTTSQDQNYYVCGHNNPDAGGGSPNPCTVVGNDNNACTTLASPCRTIQGGVDKVPRLFRHNVVVNVGPGDYKGAIVSGFRTELLWDAGTPNNAVRRAAFVIQGTMALTTGIGDTPTGTCGNGVTSPCATDLVTGANTDTTFATMTDGSKAWTSGILRGKFIEVTSNAGAVVQTYPIVDNTATTITTYAWNVTLNTSSNFGALAGVLPTITSTYRILDQASNVNTAVLVNLAGGLPFDMINSLPPPASNFTTKVGFLFLNDVALDRGLNPYFGLDKMRISGADISNYAILIESGPLVVSRSRIETSGEAQISSSRAGGGNIEINGNYHTANGATTFVSFIAPSGSVRNVAVTGSVFDGCGGAVASGCLRTISGQQFTVAGNDFRLGAAASPAWNPILFTDTRASIFFNKIDCTAPSNRIAIAAKQGTAGATSLQRSNNVLGFTGNVVSNCNVVLSVDGNGHVFPAGFRNSGTGNTTVFSLTNGAILEADRLDVFADGGSAAHDTVTSTVATNEVVIDTTKAYSFAQIDSLSTDGGVLEKSVFDLRSGVLVRQQPQ